jgi:plastocyanin
MPEFSPHPSVPPGAYHRRYAWGLLALSVLFSFLQTEGTAATFEVRLNDFEFVPRSLVIAPGDTVVWHADAPDHTVTADDTTFDSSPPPAILPIPHRGTFSHTFLTVGVNPYYCRLHGSPGGAPAMAKAGMAVNSEPDNAMNGVIRVADPTVNTPPETPLNSTPAAGATGLSNSPLLQATAFNDSDLDDTHAASQWLVRRVGSGEVVLDTGADTANLTALRVADLEASTAYEWQVRYRDDRAAWSAYSTPSQFTVTAALGAGSGLKATYFAYDAKRDVLTKQVGSRIDPVLDFNWALGKAHPSAPANNFFIYWEGTVLPEFSEEYRIRVKADGGVRVWIDGQLVIDDFVATTFAIYRSGSVALEAGIPANIRIHYFDTAANASMHLRWSSSNQPLEVIPQTRLFPAP